MSAFTPEFLAAHAAIENGDTVALPSADVDAATVSADPVAVVATPAKRRGRPPLTAEQRAARDARKAAEKASRVPGKRGRPAKYPWNDLGINKEFAVDAAILSLNVALIGDRTLSVKVRDGKIVVRRVK